VGRVSRLFWIVVLGGVCSALPVGGAEREEKKSMAIEQMGGQAPRGMAEIHGVSAGVFHPEHWIQDTLHFLPDYRSPLLEPKWDGVYRNIYAPSVVKEAGGFRLFYGAWDGTDTGHDNIYCVDTDDFLTFHNRRTLIHHNAFTHVCNVNVSRLFGGEYRMMCTAYPDEHGRNKPITFSSPDGQRWNGEPAPYKARMSDLVSIEGYEGYANADINGMNVLFYEDERFYLYFNDFQRFGSVYRAGGKDGRHFRFEGPVLEVPAVVNDVKKFVAAGQAYYLMGLHMNRQTLWYSLSRDGRTFEPVRTLGRNQGEEDRYIVSIGWVVDGERLLGYLYGAGAAPELNRNRIFARWLQKQVVFVDREGKRYAPSCSLGPDRQFIPVPSSGRLEGHFEVYAEDGLTKLAEGLPATLTAGGVYRLSR